MKEKLCVVGLDIEKELYQSRISSYYDREYTLPVGNSITLSDCRLKCPELLFIGLNALNC